MVQEIQQLLNAQRELLDAFDRFKVETRKDKETIEKAKAEINEAVRLALGKEPNNPNLRQEDIERAVHFLKELSSGKQTHLLFYRLTDGTIIEKFTGITLRPL
jgi:cystathionine beta-lyase/cystathionine gamma-synthase